MDFFTLLFAIMLFGLSALASYCLVWLVLISPALRLFTDRPGGRKVHQKITPRIGGLCIVIAFLLSVFFWHEFLPGVFPILPPALFNAVILATLGIFCIGFLDDITIFELSSKTKFVAEVLIAILLIVVSGVKLDEISLMGVGLKLGWYAWPVTVLWLVGVTNALNIVDGVDGLAGTVALIAFVSIGLLAYLAQDMGIVVVCVLCSGLILGFLLHNYPPSRIFLGDTGSLFLGMILGLLCVFLVSESRRPYPVAVAPLLVGFPLVDVFLAMTRRFVRARLNGESLVKSVTCMLDADNEHIHHRLLFRGLSHGETTLVIAIFAVTTCAVAIVIGLISGVSTIIFLLYLGLITAWFAYKLGFADRIVSALGAAANALFAMHASRNLIPVAVFNADVYSSHAFRSFKQNVFAFHFIEDNENLDPHINFSALIVNDSGIDHQKQELAKAIRLTGRMRCPLVFVADEFADESWTQVRMSGVQSLFVRKPLYIPKLLNDIYLLVRNSSSISAFESLFSNKTSVWPVVGRVK